MKGVAGGGNSSFGDGVEGGLRVAGASQHPGQIARLGTPVTLFGGQMRLD